MTKERHRELMLNLFGMPEEEITEMINSGLFNDIIVGYMIATLENMKFDNETIKKAVYEMQRNVFDTMNSFEAKNKKIY